jgi:hypothetical protein
VREGNGKLNIEENEQFKGKFGNNKKNGKGEQMDLLNKRILKGIFLND